MSPLTARPRRRLGVDAGLRLLLLLGWGCAGLASDPARAQVSPGPLAAAHREWDSPLHCFECHPRAGAGAMDQRCLACHTEVAWMKAHGRGYHARVQGACGKCHPDHGGRDFQLIAWDGGSPAGFDHARAGWPLDGKHSGLDCRACHRPSFQHSEIAPQIKVKVRSRSWLGLETACASCHADVHQGQLRRECQTCHDLRGWKPAARFDHAQTSYPLLGAHASVACEKCHLAPGLALAHDAAGAPVPVYKPLPHAECSSCHTDPHAGRFGATCASCHTPARWKSINEKGFDHDRTRYPLRGLHATVACASCHDPRKAWGPRPKFASCGSCHRDPHQGTATIAGKPADCAACHDVRGYVPSTFTVAQHAASAYPLEGAHARAECASCRARQPASAAAALGPARTLMRPRHAACVDCHLDPHRGRFAAKGARPYAEGCIACHDLERFHPSSMGVEAHKRSGYPLESAHGATPCQACHKELLTVPAASTLVAARLTRPLPLADAPTRCEGCHATPHGIQFAARKDRGACESCHDIASFSPASRFDHQRSAFPLDGSHARVACSGCHRAEKGADGKRRVTYRPTPTACQSCHVTPPTPAPEPHGSAIPSEGSGGGSGLLTTHEVAHAAPRP